MSSVEDTIVAIASPTTPAIRGIVRLSGDDVAAILGRLGIPSQSQSPQQRPRRFQANVDVGLPLGLIPVDVMSWPTRRSYTGQPSAELHTYGSLPLLQSLVASAIAAGARAALPGEFTMRAFLAGRLDLTQAEAVLGVIEADGRGSLDHALRQLAGNLSRPLEHLRAEMLDLLADVEAGLDFVDEDIEFITDQALIDRLSVIADELEVTRQTMQKRSGGAARTIIALRGRPNAGKSRLLNSLTGHDAAIVADIAGTTRDSVTIDAEIGGLPVKLIDTAGIEDSTSEISQLSQRQAERSGAEANLRLWCVDCSQEDFVDVCRRFREITTENDTSKVIDIHVATKSDLCLRSISLDGWISTSAATGAGIDELRRAITLAIQRRDGEEVGSVVGTAARCGQSLANAQAAIAAAIDLTMNEQGQEFVSAELRTAVTSLGEVTGAVYTDDILDRVFGRFCIGK